MRVLIDVTGLLSDSYFRGIGRYTRELVSSLYELDTDAEIHLLLNSKLAAHFSEVRRVLESYAGELQMHFWREPKLGGGLDYELPEYAASNLILTEKINQIAPDVFILTEHFHRGFDFSQLEIKSCKTGVFVYDLIPLMFPDEYLADNAIANWYRRRVASLESADVLYTISESSKKDIVEMIGHPQVVNVGCATSPSFQSEFKKNTGYERCDLRLPLADFFFYAGGYDQRKSVPFLIEAFSEFLRESKQDFGLVLAGEMPHAVKNALEGEIRKLGVEGNVWLLGHISQSQLHHCYRRCFAYVHVSTYEGFGLPVLEAMTCGVPVIAANNSSIPEVAGSAALLFETGRANSLVAAMAKLVGNNGLRDRMISDGLEQANKFRWSAVAEKLVQHLPERSTSAEDKFIADSASDLEARVLSGLKSIGVSSASEVDLVESLAYTFDPHEHARQLLLDVSILIKVDSKSGIQRVVRSLLKSWVVNSPEGYDVRAIYLCEESQQFKYAEVCLDGEFGITVKRTSSPYSVEFCRGDVFLGLDLHHELVTRHSEQYNDLLNSKARVYFILYDLLPVKLPKFFARGMADMHKQWLFQIARSDGVFAISKSVLQDYKNYIEAQAQVVPAPQFVYEWFRLGADISAKQDALLEQKPETWMTAEIDHASNSLNLILVGTIEPRKGHAEVLEAMYEMFDECEDVNLWLVGRAGWKVESLVKELVEGRFSGSRVFWFDDLDDTGLEYLYSKAQGYIAASFDEGFGLPIIEAAQKKLPVLARDIPVFREVAGDGATYFSSDSLASLVESLRTWVCQLREGTATPSDRIQYASWRESAEHLTSQLEKNLKLIRD